MRRTRDFYSRSLWMHAVNIQPRLQPESKGGKRRSCTKDRHANRLASGLSATSLVKSTKNNLSAAQVDQSHHEAGRRLFYILGLLTDLPHIAPWRAATTRPHQRVLSACQQRLLSKQRIQRHQAFSNICRKHPDWPGTNTSRSARTIEAWSDLEHRSAEMTRTGVPAFISHSTISCRQKRSKSGEESGPQRRNRDDDHPSNAWLVACIPFNV